MTTALQSYATAIVDDAFRLRLLRPTATAIVEWP